ncbi:hypothetical protein TTHERM_00220660 (macronuclear) [Tetrahymena thermophila SB210]|uniref:Uncharacterized protein n=1 Tax=Tetrahymena thermophila (strain SB210) TaxID=312017 RepID=I7MKV6_TETTS|nr:hypothetical protein TTHERM_00220660 [Tetrahymena thermophila SB210]EAS00393.1 hypothetical protein TTHERM_00220660 [Tetrahymena thermophila SB210]|eukprot:XP_001020638.1 hypothetical protein TTHERM_00220660 [Tetrahymena thermophila SB210]
MNNSNIQEDQFGSEQEPQQQKNSFSSNVVFGRGFWENLTSYQKRLRKDIERSEFFTPYIKKEMLENLQKDLEKEVIEAKKEMEKEANKLNAEEEYLVKQEADAIASRIDISLETKIKAIYFNENYAQKNKFFILSEIKSNDPCTFTILPDIQFKENAELNKQIQERNSQLEYPLGQALDPNYKITTPRIKKVYSYVNPKANLDLTRFGEKRDFFNQKIELTAQQYYKSFEKNALFHRGAYVQFINVHDTIFRKRNYDYRNPTLHYTWHRNPFKYFAYSKSFYQAN